MVHAGPKLGRPSRASTTRKARSCAKSLGGEAPWFHDPRVSRLEAHGETLQAAGVSAEAAHTPSVKTCMMPGGAIFHAGVVNNRSHPFK